MNDDCVYIHTPTLKDFTEVLEYALSKGKQFARTGSTVINHSLLIHKWSIWNTDTCVSIRENIIDYHGRKYHTRYYILTMDEFHKFYIHKDLLKDSR